ncbi:MAG: hypothetical protein KAH25_09525 [Bacteroidales bacterium]|nr:hypothetical protein [Bacteroidales bacterium]
MKNFKYILFTMLIAFGLMFTSCNKDKDKEVVPQGEFTFTIEQTDFDLKATVPMCIDSSMDYVMFKLNSGDWQMSPVLLTNGKYVTKVLKMAPGNYLLTDFVVYHDVAPIGVGPEDIIVRAAPEVGSEYWDLMANPLDIEIIVEKFIKKDFIVDVLCFEDLLYEKFGFTWFELNLVKIERQCFFGDICTGKLYQFDGSLYAQQSQGLQMDMPVIAMIEVWHADTLQRSFDNMDVLGEGECLEVYWANDEDLEEEFIFKLFAWLPQGGSFDWQLIHEWTFLDDDCPEAGEDGVVDYTIGDCSINGDEDFQFAPWVNLPLDAFKLKLTDFSTLGYAATTTKGTFMDLVLSEIPAGAYDITNGMYGSFCGQHEVVINQDQTYWVKIASSLRPLPAELLAQVTPDEEYTLERLAGINWALNNIQSFIGYEPDYENWYNNDPLLWSDFQYGLWYCLDVDAGIEQDWCAEALNHSTYVPMPGEYAVNIMYQASAKSPPAMQFQIVLLDP